MALGATRRQVFRDVLGDGLAIVLVGVAIGELLTVPLTSAVASLQENIGQTSLPTYVAAGLIWISGRSRGELCAGRAGCASRSVGGPPRRVVLCEAHLVAAPAVAPVIANQSGARRAGQGRVAVSVSERSLDAPKRSGRIETGATARDIQQGSSRPENRGDERAPLFGNPKRRECIISVVSASDPQSM